MLAILMSLGPGETWLRDVCKGTQLSEAQVIDAEQALGCRVGRKKTAAIVIDPVALSQLAKTLNGAAAPTQKAARAHNIGKGSRVFSQGEVVSSSDFLGLKA